jgi:fatty aldehyde decarbonylase
MTARETPERDIHSDAYRDAYSRINGMVVVGEGLADRHFRLLARAIPEDREELERLAAMEGRHAADFVGCGRNLGVKPDVGLARRLFAPLHALFLERDRQGTCRAAPITAAVIDDEGEHLGYAERWLQSRFASVEASAAASCRLALPITLGILRTLADDLMAIGMDPIDVLAGFSELFQQALQQIGFEAAAARRILAGAAAAAI